MPIICLMVRENHKMVREKSGNFVRADGWTPCWGFQAFWSCSVDFPLYNDPLAEIGHIWGFWALSAEGVGVNVEGGGGGGIFPTLCVEFCLVN